jgi:hypothetical protein
MKIALKYGLLITLGVVAWVIVAHMLVPDPASKVHSIGPGIFFNLLEISGIYLGIRTKGREISGRTTFKEGLKTGVSIALVYGLSAVLFFLFVILFLGPKWMGAEPGSHTLPLWQIILGAFAGLFLGAVLFGVIYSTVISFVLARRLDE